MRQGPSGRRPRNRHHSGNGGNGNSGGRVRSAASLRHQSFDSNCGDLRVRGNAWQVYEKYQALARDAAAGGDRIVAENYLQHAEHYFRVIEAIDEATASEQRMRNEAVASLNQQPDVPADYYPQKDGLISPSEQSDGTTSVRAPSESSGRFSRGRAPAREGSAEEKAPNPFFTQEEIEEEQRGFSVDQKKPLAGAQ
ncbi:MAG: DUF4167 domain-containing protein [Alphaproteobacteria bacterium]|nr:DUF4167 domain-containing protein [Alphaproteobacteria bacterium]